MTIRSLFPKKVILFPILLILLASCHPLRFEEPQPKKSEMLLFFPEDVQGTWFSGDPDTLWVMDNAYYLGSSKSEFSVHDTLTSDAHLRRDGDFFFLNIKEDPGRWIVMVIEIHAQDHLSFYMSEVGQDMTVKDLKKYGKAERILDDNEDFDYFTFTKVKRGAIYKMIEDGLFDEIEFKKGEDIEFH